jgi:hypothetical protein
MSDAPPRSILLRSRLMCVSTMLVFGSNWYSQTCSSSIVRVTSRPSARRRNSSSWKFARLKLDRLSAPAHGAGDKVHFEIAGREQGLRSSQSRTAGKRRKARHQFLESEGLDEIVVAAGL